MMLTHIDKLSRFGNGIESRLNNSLRFPDECYHSTVCCLSRVNIKKFHTFYRLHGISNLLNDTHVASLTKVRHAFYYLLFLRHIYVF